MGVNQDRATMMSLPKSLLLLLLCFLQHTSSQTQDTLTLLAKQVMLQQESIEESVRQSGGSGIKQVRVLNGGEKPYSVDSHTGHQMMAMHDHSNYLKTIGLGEFAAVLNGIEFRTRHNDYMLVMPHRTKSDFGAVEDIPLPEVPREVLQKTAVKDQIDEMVEWFKAFKNQDYSKRDYRKYFKPVLCYLEGAWTNFTDKIQESFPSERHWLDSFSWDNLATKTSFDAYSGAKSRLENHAWLPRKIIELDGDMNPVVGQWNYRIRCAPVNYDKDDGLALKRFEVVDDLGARMKYATTLEEHAKTRGARFTVSDLENENMDRQAFNNSLLDKLMSQIPGYDNYQADLKDMAYENMALNGKDAELNTGYYHRMYRSFQPDAMGMKGRRRSFSDPNVFMAQNTRPNIPGMRYENCQKDAKGQPVNCKSMRQRWSWAIPLEVIYLTPLLAWNPYNLRVNPTQDFRMTPKDFFEGPEVDPHPADTTGGLEQMFDSSANIHEVWASGTRVILPKIKGIEGNIRTRYPILPIYDEGNNIYKELGALKDIVMSLQKYDNMLQENPSNLCSSCTTPKAKSTNSGDQLKGQSSLLFSLWTGITILGAFL